ncbi:MAG: GNAT family N-acetyltransferase [Gammaproteobacteria bacterium]|nr:GNAT family N-acetyltransferase [Gammaproteobacteria bacterium]MDH3446815.1 GNAT family N-acetyltransferase [Gammaproteobacteria bacterium]
MPRNSDSTELGVSVTHSLSDVPAEEWDALGDGSYPFTRHCFLYGLELHHCLEPFGWHPVYFLVRKGRQLLAAIPCYIKTNSYGELVFDHAWVNAYQRSGLDYYPKLVSAIPYTPATGERFLIQRDLAGDVQSRRALRELLCRAIQGFCSEQKLSSWHVLFAEKSVLDELGGYGIMERSDVQFHWQNHEYRDFDDFLSRLNSRKRKNIKKERGSVASQNLDIRMQHGGDLHPADWQRIHDLYAGIYQRKYGTATLTPTFFQHIGEQMSRQTLVATTRDQGQIVAASLFFRSNTHLYGRVWGCDQYFHNLHFECCYYQGIDYCIAEGLEYFDPGAQGEHKLARGFLPTLTWSGHWIAHPQFRAAIEQFLGQERRYIESYRADLLDHSPYRQTA